VVRRELEVLESRCWGENRHRKKARSWSGELDADWKVAGGSAALAVVPVGNRAGGQSGSTE
jgi:hypothetical protein